jgi:tight adherence protein C
MSDLAEILSQLDLANLGFQLSLGPLVFGPIETVLLVVSLAMALLSLTELFAVIRREIVQRRIEALRDRTFEEEDATKGEWWFHHLGALVAASPFIGATERRKMLEALAAAGIKGRGRLSLFVAIKLASLAVCLLGTLFLLEWRGLFAGRMVFWLLPLLGAFVIGWRIPDFVLARLAKRRRQEIEAGMPDALDLLVICAESGLGLEQAVAQVGIDLHASNPHVAEEFAATASEMRVLSDRRVALENLAERTNLDALRSMVSTLNQSIKFGTPLAESLRVLAGEMRAARMVHIEERAARLPVLLTVPLMLFILPCLFLVLGGPIVLRVMDSLGK